METKLARIDARLQELIDAISIERACPDNADAARRTGIALGRAYLAIVCPV